MSSLAVIRQLIQKMSKEERRVARNFLTAFSIRGTDAPNQAVKLLDLLVRENPHEPPLDDRAIEILVYGKNSGTAFPRLILRLRDKLAESLTLSVNLERPNAYSERGKALHEIRKCLSQAQILQSRGAWDLALTYIEYCITLGEKYEHYEELASSIRVKLDMIAAESGKEALAKESHRFARALRCIQATKRALELYHTLGSHIEFSSGPTSLESLKNNIDSLQIEFESTGSVTVAFYLNYLEVHLSQELGLFKNASSILKRQIELITHPALNSPTRLVGAYLNLAWNEVYTRKFGSALKFSALAKSLSHNQHYHVFRCLDIDYHCHFYQGNFDLALNTINSILKLDRSTNAEFRIGKREYQKACVLFMLGRHEEVHKLLSNINPIETDIEGWNIALRMLYIMNDIELKESEYAATRIENLRKILDKLKKHEKQNPRDVLKFEILRTLVNTRFDFVETRKRQGEELKKLSATQGETRWKIVSPELIIFEQWFESKVFKQKLKLKVPLYESQILNIEQVRQQLMPKMLSRKPNITYARRT